MKKIIHYLSISLLIQASTTAIIIGFVFYKYSQTTFTPEEIPTRLSNTVFPEKISQKILASTVELYTSKSAARGYFDTQTKTLVSAAHVINSCNDPFCKEFVITDQHELEIKKENSDFFGYKACEPHLDICLLSEDSKSYRSFIENNKHIVKLYPNNIEKMFYVPKKHDFKNHLNTVLEGLVELRTPTLTAINGYGRRGYSGSPLYDNNGNVLAILSRMDSLNDDLSTTIFKALFYFIPGSPKSLRNPYTKNFTSQNFEKFIEYRSCSIAHGSSLDEQCIKEKLRDFLWTADAQSKHYEKSLLTMIEIENTKDSLREETIKQILRDNSQSPQWLKNALVGENRDIPETFILQSNQLEEWVLAYIVFNHSLLSSLIKNEDATLKNSHLEFIKDKEVYNKLCHYLNFFPSNDIDINLCMRKEPHYIYWRAKGFLAARNYDQALATFQEAIDTKVTSKSKSPDYYKKKSFVEMSKIYLNRNNFQKALEAANIGISSYPRSKELKSLISEIKVKIKETQLSDKQDKS